jgi:hypothetical protein
MRCYFMKGGHIAGFEELPGLSDRQAIDRAVDLFTARKRERLDGFEVWNGSRIVLQIPAPTRPSRNRYASRIIERHPQ